MSVLILDSDMPIVMRWNESVVDGVRKWFLAALRADGTFWGYVHILTEGLTEQRSFEGRLAAAENSRVRSIVHSISDNDLQPCPTASTTTDDGLIGLGSRSDFATLLRFNAQLLKTPDGDAFQAIVEVLQPRLIAAAKL